MLNKIHFGAISGIQFIDFSDCLYVGTKNENEVECDGVYE